MKIYFSGVGDAKELDVITEHPACPRVGEDVLVAEDQEWSVRAVVHTPFEDEYDVYVVVGNPLQ